MDTPALEDGPCLSPAFLFHSALLQSGRCLSKLMSADHQLEIAYFILTFPGETFTNTPETLLL